jgi:hypothetical protein
MRTYCGPRVDATVLGAATLLALAFGGTGGAAEATDRFRTVPAPAVAAANDAKAYTGVWLSSGDTVRLDISADGTYERSVAGRKKAARGRYRVAGTSLLLVDESGVRTTVTGADGLLEMAGYRLRRV